MANQAVEMITKVLEQTVKVAEEQVDAQLSRLNEIDDDELERLKERRLEALKKSQKQKQVRFYKPVNGISIICVMQMFCVCVFLRSGCPRAMGSIEKSPVRKTFLVK